MKFKILLIAVIVFASACKQGRNTYNTIKIEPGEDINDIVNKAAFVVPSESQYEWQQIEFSAFVHFGPNTFSRVEWGNGKEDPTIFNPTEFAPGQWVEVFKEAGMKMVILTVKHHDGFCLWPTRTTVHSVKSSNWKDGKGDIFRELVDAARAEGLKVGFYLSPADLHEIESEGGTFGNQSDKKMTKIPSEPVLQKNAQNVFEYQLDDYNTLFMNQLYELLTQYGEITEVWLDGANPRPEINQSYDFEAWYDLIRKLQPKALIAICGPDVRWCGNEAGRTRENEWSVLPDEFEHTAEDLGSRDKLADAKSLVWSPAETNTSIRRGWFYRDDQQYVKPVEDLVDNWYRTIGANSAFLLNVTPDRRGLIPEKDAERLRKMSRYTGKAFKENGIKNAHVIASEEEKRYPASNVLDGNPETIWKPEDGCEQAELIFELEGNKKFNRLVLQEGIKTHGQRIEKFAFDIWESGIWKEVASGTVVGYKNIRRFPIVETEKVRLRLLASRVCPTISFAGIYLTPEILPEPVIERTKNGMLTLSSKIPYSEIYYTLDGSEPGRKSHRYEKPFDFGEGGIVKAVAITNHGKESSGVTEANFDICKAKWKVITTSSAQEKQGGELAIDGNNATNWHTSTGENTTLYPHVIEIDLGEQLLLKGFTFQPSLHNKKNAICLEYRFETSNDGVNWKLAKQSEFFNIKNNQVLQKVQFAKAYSAKYIRFTGLSSANGDPYLAVAEIGVLTK